MKRYNFDPPDHNTAMSIDKNCHEDAALLDFGEIKIITNIEAADKFKVWYTKLKKKNKGYFDPFLVTTTPTGIGSNITIRHIKSGKEFDVSAYEWW